MDWIALILAGLCEAVGVTMINKLNHEKNVKALLFLILSFTASFSFLAIAMKTLPMGTAYAIWSGIGASGGAILGMIFYKESKDWKRIVFISIIIAATIGLKLVS